MLRFRQLSSWITLVVCLSFWACGQNNPNLNSELTEEEKAMPEAAYYSTDFVPVPDEVMDAVASGPASTDKALALENIDQLTKTGYLEMENGYSLLEDGTAYVAVRTDLPGVNRDMIHWWFWWHALKDIRYKIWCPGAHYAIGVQDMDRYTDKSLTKEERYLNNPHYPVEDVGSGAMNLSIRFISPDKFGFDTTSFKKNGIEAVVCGVVGFRVGKSTIEHTYMCHIFRKKGDGLELRSRFWIGKKLNFPEIKKLIITEDLAMDMLMHCSQEYNHLAGFLPDIFHEFRRKDR